jgi:hypothetical protein
MNCRWTSRKLQAYSNDCLTLAERLAVRFHVNRCDSCFEQCDDFETASSPLRQLAAVQPPSQLRTNIHIAISRELAREGWWQKTARKWRMAARDLMRPIAIRGVGGAVTAAVLFAAFMPEVVATRQEFPDDIPLTYLAKTFVSHPSVVASSPYSVNSSIAVVAYIDVRGGAYDFDLPEELKGNRKLHAEVANALLFTAFEPATKFGQPIPGKLLISFARQRYTVRG